MLCWSQVSIQPAQVHHQTLCGGGYLHREELAGQEQGSRASQSNPDAQIKYQRVAENHFPR